MIISFMIKNTFKYRFLTLHILIDMEINRNKFLKETFNHVYRQKVIYSIKKALRKLH